MQEASEIPCTEFQDLPHQTYKLLS